MEYLSYGNYYEPQESDPVGECSECGQDIFAREDVWIIRDEWFCGCCIDNFRTEIEEREECFEESMR